MSNNPERIYLDYAAATPMDRESFEVYERVSRETAGNPSSIHESGRIAKKTLDEARATVARIAGSQPREVVFTASGTEANNLAILGLARAYKQFGRHIIVSAIEHASVLKTAEYLEEHEGFEVTRVPVNSAGIVSLENIKNVIRPDTILISVMYVNNEIGSIQPIRKIGTMVREIRKNGFNTHLPIFHTDACQASPYFSLHYGDLNVDLMTINSSKVYGPKGVGCLVKRGSVELSPIMYGGDQEFGYRPGTENMPAISAFAYALEKAQGIREEESLRLTELRARAIEKISAAFPEAIILGDIKTSAPHILALALPDLDGERTVIELSQQGFDVSTGSACSVGKEPVSHVVRALELSREYERGVLRLSFGRETLNDDIRAFIKVLKDIKTPR